MFLNKSELIGTYLLHILIQTKLKKCIFSSQYFSNSLRMTEPLAGLVSPSILAFSLYQTDMAQQRVVDPITQLNSDTQALRKARNG